MIFKDFLEEGAPKVLEIEAFHGSPHKIERFSDEFVGQGVDQEGPGLYFTTNEEDALGYARKSEKGGYVYKVLITLKKPIPAKGKVPESDIDSLIRWCEGYEEKMMDWGSEDLQENIRLFKNSLKREKTPKDVFQSIWYNLYRYNPVEYVRNMVSLEYDGFVIQKEFLNTQHIIVYNVKAIKVLDIY